MATRRRGKGEGSIRQRADGRWEVRIDLGRGVDGKRRQKSVFAATEADAIAELIIDAQEFLSHVAANVCSADETIQASIRAGKETRECNAVRRFLRVGNDVVWKRRAGRRCRLVTENEFIR